MQSARADVVSMWKEWRCLWCVLMPRCARWVFVRCDGTYSVWWDAMGTCLLFVETAVAIMHMAFATHHIGVCLSYHA